MEFIRLTLFAFVTFILTNSVYSQNKVAEFDGINDFIDLGSSAGNNLRTIELWFKLDNNIDSNLNDFVSLVVRSTPNQHGELFLSFYPRNTGIFAGRLVFGHNQQTNIDKEVMSNSNTWSANTWHHVAGVIDSTNGMSLFIDGIKQLDIDTSTAPTLTSTYTTAVGKWGGSNIRFFRGRLDDLKFHSNAVYSNNFIPACPDSSSTISDRGNWNFNANNLSTAIDSSLGNNNVTLTGATKLSGSVCNLPLGFNNNVKFDGVNDYIDLGNAAGNNLRTIELWFKLDNNIDSTLNDFVSLIVRSTPNQHGALFLSFYPSITGVFAGRLVFGHNQQTSIDKEVMSNSNNWTANTWHHAAGVIDGSNGMSLFIDGIKQADTDTSTSSTFTSTYTTTVGKWGRSNIRFFQGRIDDLKLHSNAVYSNNFTPACPDSSTTIADRGNWNFNANNLSTAIDSSLENNNVRLSGPVKLNDSVCNLLVELNVLLQIDIKFNVFPNPTLNFIWLITDNIDKSNTYAEITNPSGQVLLLKEINSQKTKIDLSPFNSGLYIIKLIQNNQYLESKKILKL